MLITRITVLRFRTAENITLPSVGGFNVLIGKNNSGKSTILLAIQAFYKSLRGDSVVVLESPFDRRVDFTDQDTSQDIQIKVVFSLTDEERTTLLQDIVKESPQLRALTESMASLTHVEVSISLTPPPDAYSYVTSIRFSSAGDDPTANWRTLLSIESGAAKELAQREKRATELTQINTELGRFLENFDSDDFARYKREVMENGAVSYRALPRRAFFGMNQSSMQTVESLIRNAENHSEMRNNLASFREQNSSEAWRVRREPLKVSVGTFSGEQTSVPSYALNLLKSIGAAKLLYLTERRDPVGRNEARQLLEYKVTRGGPEMLRDIQSKVDKLLGVKIDAFESAASSTSERSAEMDVDDFLLEVNGAGIREALRLILDVELKKPSLLLVEEPEVHLHPALETNMMRYLRDVSASTQVFISTHSTNFLDAANTQNIYFVDKKGMKRSEVKLLNVGEAEGELPEALGIRLSSLFMFDRLVFVEALTDELVIREFATKLGVNLSQANIGFIHIGGARNFAHYASEATFSFLSKRQVRCTFLLDRDERTDTEVEKLKEQLGKKASVHVLSRREMENYLLQPRPLAEFIIAKRRTGGIKEDQSINSEAVGTALSKAADRLRPLSILKRSSKKMLSTIHINLDWTPEDTIQDAPNKLNAEIQRLKTTLMQQEQQVATVVENTKKNIEAGWKNQWQAIVLGDELLDATCKEYGVRFRKVSDGQNLAKLYRSEEIDSELISFIRGLVV